MIAAAGPAARPALSADRARTQRDDIGLRGKRRGICQDVSWGAYASDARNLALGLHSVELKRGDRAAIMENLCPESRGSI